MKYFFELSLRDTTKATLILNDQLKKELKLNSIKWDYSNTFTVDTDLADLPDLELEIAELFTDCKIEFWITTNCQSCEGYGYYEEMNCNNQSNECCGGCLVNKECPDCEEGKIEIEF
tara:strand:- start:368 stop:718 length:351 start_codon:yes stop_codon:yes gene_type:complete